MRFYGETIEADLEFQVRTNRTNRLVLVWLWMAIGALLINLARGADIQRGTTFTDGQTLSASDLHTLVDNATIVTAFLTGKSSASSAVGGDLLLLYSGGVFYKITANALLYQNTVLITGQTEKTGPETGDFLLLYDATALALKKVSAGNLSSNSIALQPFIGHTNLSLANTILPVLNNSTNGRTSLSNLFALYPYITPFTNLSAHTAPTNTDRLLIWDSVAGANKTVSLGSVITQAVTFVTLSNNAVVPVVNYTGGLLIYGQTTVSNLGRFVAQRFTSSSGALVPSTSTTNTHGFVYGQTWPQAVTCVAQCNAADNGYAVGDYVDCHSVQWDNNGTNTVVFGWSSTNIWTRCPATNQAGFPRLPNKSTGTISTLDTSKWQLTVNAVYFP